MHARRLIAPLIALALGGAAACSDDGPQGAATSTTTGAILAAATTTPPATIEAGRCDANRAAGTITFLTGFDFAATASGIEFLVAEERGWFDELCLDVEIRPSFSTANVALVAGDAAQFASAGSFTEIVRANAELEEADLVAVLVEGKVGIDALVVPADSPVQSVEDLRGRTIGVKGAVPASVLVMLRQAGLAEGDYAEVLLDGFDPVAHLASPIDALPVYKSNEPGILERAGVGHRLFDPAAAGVPGTFGVVYTSAAFLAEHPTAAEDVVRAAVRGLQDAIADPDGAVDIAVARIQASSTATSLTEEGERFRWRTESQVVASSTAAGEVPGLIDEALLGQVVAAHVAAGALSGSPDITESYDADLARRVVSADGAAVAWPG